MTGRIYEWVAQTRGPNRGRIGMIHARCEGKAVIVPRHTIQFGSDGPWVRLLETSLRPATLEEIASIYGCRVLDLSENDIPARLR